MAPAGFKPAIPANQRPQTHAGCALRDSDYSTRASMRVRAIGVCVSGVAATGYMAPLIWCNLFLLGKKCLKI